MKYFTSDTHFGHARIIELCNRPFDSVDEMNEALIDNWNSLISAGDTVYHLGDVALGPWMEWDGILTQLNGYKHLVIGNHDRIFEETKISQVERFAPHYAKWFPEEVINARSLVLADGTVANLSHFPYDGDSHGGDRFARARMVDDGTILIHGHTHSNEVVSRSKAGTLQIHVGVDAWNFAPVSEEQILDIIKGEL